MKKRWYCLRCKEFVDVYIDFFKGFSMSCKKCGGSRIIELKDMDDAKFKRLVKEFKDKTGKFKE